MKNFTIFLILQFKLIKSFLIFFLNQLIYLQYINCNFILKKMKTFNSLIIRYLSNTDTSQVNKNKHQNHFIFNNNRYINIFRMLMYIL